MVVKKLNKKTRGVKKQKWRPRPKNKNEEKNQETISVKPKKKRVLLIAQELKFARTLASNDKKARAKMLKNLRSWLTVRSKSSFAFTENEFMRLWKGLYYCMWLSDKPLVQEDLAESISHLIHCFESLDMVIMYATCTLKTLSSEWFGIDHYRMDKFEMLVRRIIRQIFVVCKKQSWDEQWTKGMAGVIETTLIDPKGSLAFKFHITEVFMEELAKISGGVISKDMVIELLRPFAIYLATMTDGRQISHVAKHIFRYLIFQSDVGLEYMQKFRAWKNAGFPTGSIDAMQKIELSDDERDDEEEEKNDEVKQNQVLDPRAGSVHVDLPQVPFDPRGISQLIQQYKFHPSSTKKNRQQITRLINEFDELAKGIMPIGIKKVRIPSAKSSDTNPKVAAKRLLEFEEQLYADSAHRLSRKNKKSLATQNDENDENYLEISQSPKAKKPKINEKTIDDLKNTMESEFSNEEMTKIKTKNAIHGTDKLKKKSLQKGLKNKKSKLREVKQAIQGELMDGIDDFAIFKNKAMISKKKKNKIDLNNSWEVSSVENSPVVSQEKKIEAPSNNTPVKLATKESTENEKKKPEKASLDKILWLHPVIKKLDSEALDQRTSPKSAISPKKELSSKKRVKIALQRNTAQDTSEYFQQLRLSPAIPFDANRKPRVGVLKASPLANPINPFYKKLKF